MSVVIADKVRYTRIGGKNTGQKVVVREGMKLLESFVEASNAETHNTGIEYVVNKKATDARNKKQKAEPSTTKEVKEENSVKA